MSAAHLTLSGSVQQLEAGQPHARLRVQVDFHAARRPEPQQPPHLAHPAAEALGLPSAATSAHSKGSPHLLLSRRGPTRLVRAPPHPLPPLCGRGRHYVIYFCFIPDSVLRATLILNTVDIGNNLETSSSPDQHLGPAEF